MTPDLRDHPEPTEKPACPHCAAAQSNTRHALHDATCLGCLSREIARSPDAWRAVRGETATGLRDAILRVWGASRIERGRTEVWFWIKALGIKQRAEASR